MNGVEAAASLFGSTDSETDLFATLGTETTSSQFPPSEDFFSDSASSSLPVQNALDFSTEADSFLTEDTSAIDDYSGHVHTLPNAGNDDYNQSHGGYAAHGYWDEPGQNQIGPIQAEVSDNRSTALLPHTIDSSSNYLPPINSTMTPPTVPAYSPANAYDISAQAPANQYLPESPAKTSAKQQYAPYTSSSTYTTSSTYTASSTASNSHYSGVNSVTPIQKATPSSLTRPKVSNAYDPPFIPTSSSRRPARTSSGQQVYNTYQTQASLSPYLPPAGEHNPYAGPGYGEYKQASPDVSMNATGTNYTAPGNSGAKYSGGVAHRSIPPPELVAHYSSFDNASEPHANGHGDGMVAAPEQSPPHTTGNYAPTFYGAVGYNNPSLSPQAPSNAVPKIPPYLPESTQAVVPNSFDLTIPSVPYSPPILRGGSIDAVESSASANNVQNHQAHYNSYAPHQPPIQESHNSLKDTHDPYAPKANAVSNNYIPRTSSPLSVYNGYQNESRKPSIAAPSNLNGQSSSGHPSFLKPLGVPPSHIPIQATRPLNGLNNEPSLRSTSHRVDTKLGVQELIIKASSAQYAPSPSLIGSNDPLARTSARAPVVTFGFGGKMMTCFYGMPGLNTGFDVALSSRTSSELRMHTLHKLLPESVINTPSPSYPGPLLSDPGTPSLSLVRPSQSTQAKAKKTAVITYLSARASEIDQGLGYLTNDEKRAAEGKLILVNLLKIMVENDGRLLGTPQSDLAVRTTLVPRLDGAATATLHDGNTISAQVGYKSVSSNETPISVTTLLPSSLDKIQDLLLLGDRRQAYQFAMDEQLWAHAMVIASSIDKESWKEVVNDFLRSEIGAKDDVGRLTAPFNGTENILPKNNRESLRVAYSLFSGQGAASVQELVPPSSFLQRTTAGVQPPATLVPSVPTMTPRTPNFAPVQPTLPIPSKSLEKWAETVAMMISSPLPLETSGALTALGDQLLANNWVEAAHSCYILSPQTSLVGGLGSPSARITLVGTKNPGDISKDPDALTFSEIHEFALSLAPLAKGQEAFHGLPHLQAYRFIRAIFLAESGHVQLANRYCEAITASVNHASPYTTIALLEQLHGLSQRLTGVDSDKSGSWMGGKLAKPSLDTIGGWLEGRFTKLVTGDSDSAIPTPEETKAADHPFTGPFAHYSTISSTTPSARSSPQPQSTNLSMQPPPRTSSAMASTTAYPHVQIERSSSALGYMRQKPTIHTSINSIGSSQSSPVGFGTDSVTHTTNSYAPQSTSPADDVLETPVQGATWWGYDADNASTRTPTAATFMQVDESSIQPSTDGFISLMDNQPLSVGPQPVKRDPSRSPQTAVDEDDLGFGNPKPKQVMHDTQSEMNDTKTPASESKPIGSNQPADSQAGGKSWFGGWWKRSDPVTPGPIKASLGEESAFFYDKEQKRWVNRKKGGGSEETAKPAATPPPPLRAQTASPGMSSSRIQSTPTAGPPPRSSSAIDLGAEPPMKIPARIRSNLAPPTESAPPTPTGTRLNAGTPPPGRPKSSAAKRNIRSRYVDVFQQEGSGGA
ncbi:Sec23-binding domain of Sec16-domain-containing protein [Crassisporium funariophilum]|nr:Sec23-binding domain of Sec16-domain-containing protein [Crassisporium funariophilum]